MSIVKVVLIFPASHQVAPHRRRAWDVAVSSAEQAHGLTRSNRIERYIKQPISPLVKSVVGASKGKSTSAKGNNKAAVSNEASLGWLFHGYEGF